MLLARTQPAKARRERQKRKGRGGVALASLYNCREPHCMLVVRMSHGAATRGRAGALRDLSGERRGRAFQRHFLPGRRAGRESACGGSRPFREAGAQVFGSLRFPVLAAVSVFARASRGVRQASGRSTLERGAVLRATEGGGGRGEGRRGGGRRRVGEMGREKKKRNKG